MGCCKIRIVEANHTRESDQTRKELVVAVEFLFDGSLRSGICKLSFVLFSQSLEYFVMYSIVTILLVCIIGNNMRVLCEQV